MELGKAPTGVFAESKTRRDFITKVYTILSVQLVVAAGIIWAISVPQASRAWCREHHYLVFVPMAIFFVAYIALICCDCARRTVPLNFFVLGTITVSLSFVAGMIAATKEVGIILLAAIIVAASVVILTLIAAYGPDITRFALILCILSLIQFVLVMIFMLVVSLSGATFEQVKPWHVALMGFSMLLVLIYIIFDTQMIIGGGKVQLSEEEYIYGAALLFVDIVYLFLFVLELLDNK